MVNPVTENINANMDVAHPAVEVVDFKTSLTGDYYLCEKIRHIDGAFACQKTADGTEIQVSWENLTNCPAKVTLTLSTGNVVDGFLVIYGRL